METRSKSSRSSIWRYFEPIDFRQTKCLLCDGTYRNSGNTTNLIDHLKRMHPEEYDMVMELISKQPKECAATLDEDTIAIANIKFEEDEDNNNTNVKNVQIDAIGDRNAADGSLDAVITTTTTTTANSEQAIGEKQAVDESSGRTDSLPQIESTLVELDEHNNNNNNNIETSVEVETSSGQTVIAQIPVINGVVEQAIETHEYQICKIVPLPHARSEVWSYFGFVADDEGTILDRSKVVCKLCQSAFCYSGNTTNFYSHLKSMHSEVQLRSATGQKGSARGTKRSYASFATNDYDDADDDDADGGGGGGGGGGGRDHQDFNENNNSIAASTSQSQTQASSSSSSQHYSTQQQQQQHMDPIPERSRDDLICVADITDYIIDFIIADCRPIDVTQGIGFRRLLRLLAPGYQLPERHRLELAIRRKYDEMRKRRELEENSF